MRPPLAPDWRELSLRRSNVCVPQRSQLFNRTSQNRSGSGKPCLRDHLSITTIFPCTVGWSLKTGFTVFYKQHPILRCLVFDCRCLPCAVASTNNRWLVCAALVCTNEHLPYLQPRVAEGTPFARRAWSNRQKRKPILPKRQRTRVSAVWEIPRSGYTHVTGRRRMSAVVFACRFEGLRLGHTFGSMRAWQPKCGCSKTDLLLAETLI